MAAAQPPPSGPRCAFSRRHPPDREEFGRFRRPAPGNTPYAVIREAFSTRHFPLTFPLFSCIWRKCRRTHRRRKEFLCHPTVKVTVAAFSRFPISRADRSLRPPAGRQLARRSPCVSFFPFLPSPLSGNASSLPPTRARAFSSFARALMIPARRRTSVCPQKCAAFQTEMALERFTFEKGENARRRHSAARPKVSGKTAFFPRNDRPYGLKCKAFQTEIAPDRPTPKEENHP